MEKTPKSLRLHIGIFGRTNVGKSSFLNMVAGQDVAITSVVPGTTTDVVEKVMELLPLGPVVFLDTAGLDDVSVLSALRLRKTRDVFNRSDVIVLVAEAGTWNEYEEEVWREAQERKVPLVVAVNKSDVQASADSYLARVREKSKHWFACSSINLQHRDEYVHEFKSHLLAVAPEHFFSPQPLVGDLVPAGGTVVLIVPIDLEAPQGRIILPQVQTIREVLDADAMAMVVKDREYPQLLARLKEPPQLVVCDSQVVQKMVADTPPDIKCTTFSILFSRYRGDLRATVQAVKTIDCLQAGDRVLVAEACSHHPLADDIGRVKLPRWLRQYTGLELTIDTCAGHDFPADLDKYKLAIHCGGCMINRREMLSRLERARAAGVPMTNYGVAISHLQGVLPRVLSPFPAALEMVGLIR
jgi:[FeFe] hydrogenase H-cluster maturation GTPase HydF